MIPAEYRGDSAVAYRNRKLKRYTFGDGLSLPREAAEVPKYERFDLARKGAAGWADDSEKGAARPSRGRVSVAAINLPAVKAAAEWDPGN